MSDSANEEQSLWWVGLCLDAVATLAGTCGKQLLRYAAVTGNPWFYPLGLLLTAIVDPFFDLAAYSFTAQSIVAAASGLVVVWNVLLAPCTLGEALTRSRAIGALLICVGTVCVGLFGNHAEVDRQGAEYLTLFTRPPAAAYYAGFILWGCACAWVCGVPRLVKQHGSDELAGFLMVAFGGSLAGNSFTTKAAVEMAEELASEALSTHSFSADWNFYVFIALSLTTASSSLFLLAVGLTRYEALYMITVFQGFMIITGALSGNLVMDEKHGQSRNDLALYWLSISVVLYGLYILCKGEWAQAATGSPARRARNTELA